MKPSGPACTLSCRCDIGPLQPHRGAEGAAGHLERARPARPAACAPSSIRSRPSRCSPSCPASPPPAGRAASGRRSRSSGRRRRASRYSLAMRAHASPRARRRSPPPTPASRRCMCSTSRAKAVLPSQPAFGQHFAVGADLDRVDLDRAFSASLMPGLSCTRARRVVGVPDQRLARGAVAQVVAVRPDQVGRRGALRQERQVEPLARRLVQQHVDQREQEGRVGLGLDRHPFGRAGAGDRQVRLDLHALHAAHARLGVAPDAGHAARGLDVGAAGDQVVASAACRGRR